MSLPFTPNEFLDLMRRYNEGVWPAQVALSVMALASIAVLTSRNAWRDRVIAGALALLWAWAGVSYQLLYFWQINRAALSFGALFVAGAALFAWQGVIERRLRFVFAIDAKGMLGIALLAYALVVYPLAASVLGHSYPRLPTMGTPCPTVIFTIGMLGFVEWPFPRYVLIAPLLWTLIGGSAAFLFGMYEDWALFAAGAAAAWLAWPPKARFA